MPDDSGYLHVYALSKTREVFVLSPPERRRQPLAMSGGNPKEGVLSLVTTAREPRAYELMVIFLPELADDDLTAQLDRAGGYITDVGGTIKEVLTDSPWGRRRLAYPIRFNSQDLRDGFYAVYHFDLVPSAVADIERELKLDTRVMRYLVVHDDPKAGEKNTGGPEGDGAQDSAVADAPTEDLPGVTAADSSENTTAQASAGTDEPTLAPAETESTSAEAETGLPASAPASEDTAAPTAIAEEDGPSEPAPGEEVATAPTTEDAPADPEQEDEP